MATWHQMKGGNAGLAWQPHATEWKVVCDKPGEMTSSMSFTTREKAEINARNSGGVLIPPLSERAGKATC